MDLVRDILLLVEQLPPGAGGAMPFPHGVDQEEFGRHVELLIDAGYLQGSVYRQLGRYVGLVISDMTWSGHDYLEAIRNEGVWKETKRTLLERGGAMTFELVKAVANAIVLRQLGLPPG